jgi:predicted acylesterase/phospholipase RssA
MVTRTKLVLSIDGNGKKGIFSYFMLEHIMKDDVLSHVDLIFGVSSGAIAGALYATGLVGRMTERDIVQMGTPIRTETRCIPLYKSMVPGWNKTLMLWRLFGDRKLGDVDVPLCILVDGVGDTPRIFRSWDPEDGALALYKILDATSAFPAIFPSVEIQGKHYIDGGSISYSPTTLSYLTALEYFPPGAPFRLLSLGTQRTSFLRTMKSCSGLSDHFKSGIFHHVFDKQNHIMESVFQPKTFLRMEPRIKKSTSSSNCSFQEIYELYQSSAQTAFDRGLEEMVSLGWR